MTDRRPTPRPARSIVPIAILACVAVVGSAVAAAAPATTTTAASASPVSGGAPIPTLLAHGTDDWFWIAQTRTDAGAKPQQTILYARQAGEDKWTPIASIPSRLASMTSRGSQLAVLLDDGGWMFVSADATASGPPLPDGARIVTLAGDGETLWAVGSEPVAASASTRPSGGAALRLYWLGAFGWNRGVPLPADVRADVGSVSLAMTENNPVIAWRAAPRVVHVYRRTSADDAWAPPATIEADFDVARLSLLTAASNPVVWIAGARGEGAAASLDWLLPDRRSRRVPIDLPARNRPDNVAAAVAAGKVRALYLGAEGKLVERTYEAATGQPAADAAVPVQLPLVQFRPEYLDWVHAIIIAALLATIVASVRRRTEMRDALLDPHRRPLAPVGRRLIAGAVDAMPFLIAFGGVWVLQIFPDLAPEEWSIQNDRGRRLQFAVLGAAGGLYLAHTTIAELIAGRSLGKWLTGLTVVGLDGQPAPPGAVLIRNLLRVIDIAIVFLPLLLILFSPLRQRAGDVAAGTLVVLANAPPEPDPGSVQRPADTPAEESKEPGK